MKMEKVKLLGVRPSPYSYRVIWALELKGVKHEYVKEDAANKSDLLLRYNPIHQKVPVLVHNEKPISESTVILEYKEETWPHNPLLPTDPHERAFARFWIKFLDKSPTLLGFNLTVGEEQEKATKEERELLKIIEEQGLGKKKYFGGDKIGLADLVFGFIPVWLGVLEKAAGVKVMKPAAADDFPRLQVWIKNNFRENSVIKANLPDPRELLAHSKRKREVLLESKIA